MKQLDDLNESIAAHLLSSILQWLMCTCVALPRYLLKHYSRSFWAACGSVVAMQVVMVVRSETEMTLAGFPDRM